MRFLICGAIVTSLLALGCTRKESNPGGPGVDKGQSADVFTLKVPPSVKVKKGEQKKVKITVDRGRKFDQAVKLSFQAPRDVELTPADAEVKKGETEREFVVKAGKDAKAGRHSVKVTGKPESGTEATVMFTVSIAEREEKPKPDLPPMP